MATFHSLSDAESKYDVDYIVERRQLFDKQWYDKRTILLQALEELDDIMSVKFPYGERELVFEFSRPLGYDREDAFWTQVNLVLPHNLYQSKIIDALETLRVVITAIANHKLDLD